MRTFRERLRNQQGMALVGVMLLLILASGVCAALAVSGKTETMAAFNLDSNAQARAAAQAGLTASAQVLIEYLENTPLDVKPAMSAVLMGPDADASTLGDNGSLWSVGGGAPTGLPGPGTKELLNNITGVSYEVVALDDDDWTARGGVAGVNTTIQEDGAFYNDDNRRIVVRATGYGRNNTKVVLEGIISRPQLGGIVVGADLRFQGSGIIDGDGAGVHANHDLDFNGNPDVYGPVTATGTIIGAPSSSTSLLTGQDAIDIPPINASDFLPNADYYLTSAGVIRNKDLSGAWVDCPACTGATFSGGEWTLDGSVSGRYFVNAHAKSGNHLNNISIYATGNIEIRNNDDITAYGSPSAKAVALVSDSIIYMRGNNTVSGSLYARELVDFGGNVDVTGQVVAENRSDSTVVNYMGGGVHIHWDGDTMIGSFGVSSWREVK
jgi:hypothetical protein